MVENRLLCQGYDNPKKVHYTESSKFVHKEGVIRKVHFVLTPH